MARPIARPQRRSRKMDCPLDQISIVFSANSMHLLWPIVVHIEPWAVRTGPLTSGRCVAGRAYTVVLAICIAMLTSAAFASPSGSLYDGPDGATCNFFNLGARVAWQNKAGDWTDAKRQAQGNAFRGFAQCASHVDFGQRSRTSVRHNDRRKR